MTDNDTLLIEPGRSTCLCGNGAPGYRAIVAVDAEGIEHLILADVDRINDDSARVDTTCAAVGHEQLGALPYNWRARIQLAPLLCGRMTRRGTRCRIPVTRAGASCAKHKAAERSAREAK